MRSLICVVCALALGVCGGRAASPAILTMPSSYVVNMAIPDGMLTGVSDSRTVTMPGYSSITDVQVRLTISGGFNGDYYAWLSHGSGFAVLLNRSGRTTSNPIGYDDSGFDVTFTSQSANDIHNYRDILTPSGAVTGEWSPDARNVSPTTALDTSPRSAFLSSFGGVDPNGVWTLFVADADYNSGTSGTWMSWGLSITAVPEPSIVSLAVVGLGCLVWRGSGRRLACRGAGLPSPAGRTVRRVHEVHLFPGGEDATPHVRPVLRSTTAEGGRDV